MKPPMSLTWLNTTTDYLPPNLRPVWGCYNYPSYNSERYVSRYKMVYLENKNQWYTERSGGGLKPTTPPRYWMFMNEYQRSAFSYWYQTSLSKLQQAQSS